MVSIGNRLRVTIAVIGFGAVLIAAVTLAGRVQVAALAAPASSFTGGAAQLLDAARVTSVPVDRSADPEAATAQVLAQAPTPPPTPPPSAIAVAAAPGEDTPALAVRAVSPVAAASPEPDHGPAVARAGTALTHEVVTSAAAGAPADEQAPLEGMPAVAMSSEPLPEGDAPRAVLHVEPDPAVGVLGVDTRDPVGGSEPGEALDEPSPESRDAEPADLEPADLEPADREPAGPEPVGPEPVGPEPVDLEPVDLEPGRSEAVDEEPTAAEPVDSELEPVAPAPPMPTDDPPPVELGLDAPAASDPLPEDDGEAPPAPLAPTDVPLREEEPDALPDPWDGSPPKPDAPPVEVPVPCPAVVSDAVAAGSKIDAEPVER